jgi:tetratricopeptide (TPR) repeat protein
MNQPADRSPSGSNAWPEWPDDWRVMDETLDPRRIEEQGKFQLYRALNTQHLIAFVGSGISAAYGRVSWGELVLFHVLELERFLTGLDPKRRDQRHDLLKQLLVFTNGGKGIRDPITALMLCEQVWRVTPTQSGRFGLKQLAQSFSLTKRLEDLQNGAAHEHHGQELFRTWIKRETHNEFPHVLRVLGGIDTKFSSFLEKLCGHRSNESKEEEESYAQMAKGSPELRKLAMTLTEPWKRGRADVEGTQREYAALFSVVEGRGVDCWLEALRNLENLPVEAECARVFAKQVLTELKVAAGKHPISPVRYFAFGLVLDLLRLHIDVEKVRQFLGDILKSTGNFSAADFKSRDSLIPRSADPLREMAYGLFMHRFATTNYDLEIERFFHDMAFEPSPSAPDPNRPGTAIRVGPLGGRTRDFVLSDQTVADLIDFATGDNAFAFEVVHLHGRATADESIVVTERDYQNTYVRGDKLQAEINEAREAAFGGNPLFFTGFGMSELDVLRPLREFVTGPVRHNRAAIALLPADKSRAENASFAMEQYVKYGVSVLRYDLEAADRKGVANGKEAEDKDKDKDKDKGLLCVILEAIEDLKQGLRDAAQRPADRPVRDEIFAELEDLPEKFRKASAVILALPERFHCDQVRCAIEFEIWFLKQFALESAKVVIAHAKVSAHAKVKNWCDGIAPPLLERLKVSIQTAVLCSKLAAIRRGWQEWWREWQRAPVNRSDFRRYSKRPSQPSPAEAAKGGPIWSRHRVNEHHDQAVRSPSSWDTNAFKEAVPKGRRCIVITSRNGFGKGHLYSHLTATHHNSEQWGIAYLGQFFTTFGYDSEIASVWDALPMFLLSPEHFPLLGSSDVGWELVTDRFTRDNFRSSSRLERLHRSLQVAQGKLADVARSGKFGHRRVRLLIAFNVFDLLFGTEGQEEQREIHDIFRVLLAEEYAHLPIDLLFVVRDTHLPVWFRLPDAALPARGIHVIDDLQLLMPATPQGQSSRYEEAVRATLQRSRARLIASQRRCTSSFDLRKAAKLPAGSGPSRSLLYVLPPPDPKDFNLDCFDAVKEFLDTELKKRYPQESVDERLRDFFHQQLNSNRYAYVLVIMIARDILQSPRQVDERKIERLSEFLSTIDLMPQNFNGGVSDRFFELVLDYWFEQRARGAASHGEEDPAPDDEDPVLDELLIRHIGVISMPVQASVLAHSPRIRSRLGGYAPDVVKSALDRLVKRGLVFHIDRPDPNEIGRQDPNEGKYPDRYQVHRSIRAHVHRRLGSQQTQPATAHVYGPSLYAAQTRNFPRLNTQAYLFLCELVDELSFYPYPESCDVSPTDLTSDGLRPESANCLRAALGIVRNLCSLGAITRFADAEALPPHGRQDSTAPGGTAHMGYLERHRLVIRWMIKLAAWLNPRHCVTPPPVEPPPLVNPPFYRDETIWLYNECGVFSYAQGRCYDARAFFERALQLQGEIDGARGGPMRRRILLNAALNAIDAGRLTLARRCLEEVEPAAHEDRLCRLLAVGFLGWVDHLSGKLSRARERYDESIAGLKQLELIRPTALIKQFSGYLYLHLEKFERARNEFRDVIQLAEAGGYADLGHYARLNEAKAYVRDPEGTDRIDSALRRLHAAQDYADRMDIPRLSVDVLLFRGEILLKQGERTRAGQLMARGLQIANLNGMMFRRIFAMEWLSAVYEARDNGDAAARLRAYTLRAARACGYHLSVFRTNRAVF